jgi:serine/threonine-protein kinase
MFIDEARTAASVRHPNVVPIIDVIATDDDLRSVVDQMAGVSIQSAHELQGTRGELLLVMDYVAGLALNSLVALGAKQSGPMPPAIASSIASGLLEGLAAVHEATFESGEPRGIVHRDVSPQNTMVGTDGITRVVDFGIADAASRILTSNDGSRKGKVAYMAPEQILGGRATKSSDIYSAGVVLWEMLTGLRLFRASNDVALLDVVMAGDIRPPSEHVTGLGPGLDDVVLRALHHDPSRRFASARDLLRALEDVLPPASTFDVSSYVKSVGANPLAARAARLAEIESDPVAPSTAPDPPASVVPTVTAVPAAAPAAPLHGPSGVPSAPAGRRVLVAVGVAALASGVLGALLYFRVPPASGLDAIPADRDLGALAASSPTPASPAMSARTETAIDAPMSAPVTAPASPPVADATKASPRSTAPRGGRSSGATDCRVPFITNAAGKRIYKRACLQ